MSLARDPGKPAAVQPNVPTGRERAGPVPPPQRRLAPGVRLSQAHFLSSPTPSHAATVKDVVAHGFNDFRLYFGRCAKRDRRLPMKPGTFWFDWRFTRFCLAPSRELVYIRASPI